VRRTPVGLAGITLASQDCNHTSGSAPAGVRGMRATAPIAAAETLVTLPRAAALLLTPRMRCPFPDIVDAAYWDGSPWYVATGTLRCALACSRTPDSAVFGRGSRQRGTPGYIVSPPC